ncbi:protein FolC [Ostertagia ostertagi]
MTDRFVFGRFGRWVASVPVVNPFHRREFPLLTVNRSTVMIPAAFSHTLVKELPQNPYEVAVLHLNSLQSNAVTLQKVREKRNILQETNIPNTICFLNKCGIELNDLDRLNIVHVSGTKGKRINMCICGIYSAKGWLPNWIVYVTSFGPRSREDSYQWKANQRSDDEGSEGMPPYFKFLTLLSFHVFLEECVDVAIVEVGIGGEYDCTNIIQHPLVCGISTLDIDHTTILGSTLPSIAWHKAGILKNGSPAVMSPASPDALAVIEKRGLEREVDLRTAPPYESYSFATGTVSAGIDGEHQKLNISLALQLARTWLKRMGHEVDVFPEAHENEWRIGEPFNVPQLVVEALESCQWPGRSQVIDTDRIRFYLDGAHTPKSMEMHSFDYALFCPTALKVSPDMKSDLTNINQAPKDQMIRSQQCATVWKEIGSGEVFVFDCISSTVQCIERLSEAETLDVLVTGSLHLVGGVLSLIEPSMD